MQIVVSANAYRSEIDGDNLETELNTEGYQFSDVCKLLTPWEKI